MTIKKHAPISWDSLFDLFYLLIYDKMVGAWDTWWDT